MLGIDKGWLGYARSCAAFPRLAHLIDPVFARATASSWSRGLVAHQRRRMALKGCVPSPTGVNHAATQQTTYAGWSAGALSELTVSPVDGNSFSTCFALSVIPLL